MGKKGRWFTALKKVFVSHSKDKPTNEPEQQKVKKKNKGHGKLRQGERKPFIPLFREPSSIEKILGDAEREHGILFRPPFEPPRTPPFVRTPTSAPPQDSSPRVASPRAPLRVVSHHREIEYLPVPTLKNQHASATKIQAAFRGYMARRSFRALRGLVRLQGAVRGQNVKRQTMNAMKYMQLLVRVQSQIQSRRIHVLDNQVRQQELRKDLQSNLGKMSLASEAGNHEDWDDSLLTKKEVEARLQRKVDAVIRRERAMAYAYSHRSPLTNIHSAGYPWWWNWLEGQIPQLNTPETLVQTPQNYGFTPQRQRSRSQLKPSPRAPSSSANKQPGLGFHIVDPSATPMSTRSSILVSSSKLMRTPPSPSERAFPSSTGPSMSNKYTGVRARGIEPPFGMKDDDSLVSCPTFSVPNYMVPTVSAKAKVRANSNPKDRVPGTPTGENETAANRRSSFPLSQGMGSFNWNKGSIFPGLQRGRDFDKHQPLDSTGNLSVDSTVSLPAGAIGRKPFSRFV
ncbi:hypothetical protein SAY87_011417 [Trapa incisa]|uniref:DUF4005 domain-containing protein n=1 Tax=Trapa incisa TaxID=236973 RepID=A0AAN7JJ35_9MYRT|nr:hypothetical protein SAY87_011417 [Trapa incisa]